MRVAVVGCCHGELKLMYDKILRSNMSSPSSPVDLVLVTGDFQAVRDTTDLNSMSVPQKYLRFGDFREYFEGKLMAPILTIFIGGNHESSNYMRELYYGGWVCPNIYYMGSAGVLRVGGLRIAGLSGIYTPSNYHQGYFEKSPFQDYKEKRSVYHYRDLDVWRLGLFKAPIDVFLSHDWPQGIWDFGDRQGFLRKKPFLKQEIANGEFGSPPLMSLMDKLRARFWFASHMHCRFEAQYNSTFFMALDKCVKGREFFDVIDISPSSQGKVSIEYDPEWLDILRSTASLVSLTKSPHGPLVEDIKIEPAQLESLSCAPLDQSENMRMSVKKHYIEFLDQVKLKDPFILSIN